MSATNFDYFVLEPGQRGPEFLPGTLVTGATKLAQRLLMLLMTETDSMPYLPQFGCNFMSDGRLGAWRTVADLRQSFASAMVEVRRQLQALETPEDTLDELYGMADLVDVVLDGGKAAIRILLASQSGTKQLLTQLLNIPLTG